MSVPDLIVLVTYLGAVVGTGFWFTSRSRNTSDFMEASRSLPGWAVGLSMFGSYISSISFLANPGKAYAGNWNPFVFSLATPIAAAIAVKFFVPFYRNMGAVSAYEHLEHRFGAWARTYAVACFLLTQVARTGTVIYLLALAVGPLTGWKVQSTILATGVLMTSYTAAGGIKAVVWTGVLQASVLVAGTALCIAAVLFKTPGGPAEILHAGFAEHKFNFGSFAPSLTESTFWVVFLFGLVSHLANFGTDQSYIQRYLTARSDKEAVKSVWMTTLLYVPVAAVFFLIGTGLFYFYRSQPALLPSDLSADEIFPHFIATQLPAGLAGLVVAAIFAASMDSNLNSMATLTLCDVYKRYLRPHAGEAESMRVLYVSTVGWGAVSTGIALAMVRVGHALDVWWMLSGLFSGGVLGLFLLGLVSRRCDPAAGALAVVLGIAAIAWMSLPMWLEVPSWLSNPMHTNMTMVVATAVILVVGIVATACRRSRLDFSKR